LELTRDRVGITARSLRAVAGLQKKPAAVLGLREQVLEALDLPGRHEWRKRAHLRNRDFERGLVGVGDDVRPRPAPPRGQEPTTSGGNAGLRQLSTSWSGRATVPQPGSSRPKPGITQMGYFGILRSTTRCRMGGASSSCNSL